MLIAAQDVAGELMAARYQMALSLGFHIVLSCFGVALPALIYVLHRRGLKHPDPIPLDDSGVRREPALQFGVLREPVDDP
jgi:hypothetical protein